MGAGVEGGGLSRSPNLELDRLTEEQEELPDDFLEDPFSPAALAAAAVTAEPPLSPDPGPPLVEDECAGLESIEREDAGVHAAGGCVDDAEEVAEMQ